MTFKEYYMKESLSNNDTANNSPDATQMIPVSAKQEKLRMEDEEDKHKGMMNASSEANNQTDKCSSLIRTKSAETGGGGSKKTSHHKISRKVVRMAWEMKATKTSVMLLIVYLLCWAPLGILYMIDHICRNCISNDPGSETNRFVVKVISFASSLLLPLVYCWRTKEFRHELANFLWRKRSESRTSYRSENLM